VSKPTILLITREFPPVGGGAGNVAYNLVVELAAQGFNLEVLTMGFKGLEKAETLAGMPIHRLACGRRQIDSSYFLEMLVFVFQSFLKALRLRKSRYDLVVSLSAVPDGLAALGAAKLLRCPYVVITAGSDVPGYDPRRMAGLHRLIAPFWRLIVSKAAAVTAPTQAFAALIQKNLNGLPVQVIPNGISAKRFSSAAQPREGLLVCSRLIARKNIDQAIQALQFVQTPTTLDIVGDGPELSKLQELATHVAPHQVRFHGWLANDSAELADLYQKRQFFLQVSEKESFGVTVLEAQAAGMVVIASRIPAFEEVLGQAALFTADASAKSIAATINEATSMPHKALLALAEEGQSQARQKYLWANVAEQYGGLFDQVVSVANGS